MNCNPYLPFNEYIPDGEPRVFGERIYVYGSHDEANVNRFCVNDYVIYSADMSNLGEWRYEGISYRRDSDPHNRDNKHALFAPDVVQGLDGYYYLYYGLSFLQEIGVARSKYPQGPFTFYGHVQYQDENIMREDFPYDPSVLVEGEHVYLYYGFAAHFSGGSFGTIIPSPGCMMVELQRDMITVKTKAVMVLPTNLNCHNTSFPPEHAYFEAPSIRKINGKYYLVYSSQAQHELCYAVSDFPNRDFQYGGVIISNGDVGLKGNSKPVNYTGTNHGGLVEIQGDWYIFYHRNTHAIATSRQGCAEKIHMDETGHISQVGVSSYGLTEKEFLKKTCYSGYEVCYLENKHTSPRMKIGLDYKEQEPYLMEEQDEHFIAHIFDQCQFGYHSILLGENQLLAFSFRGQAKGTLIISSDREGKEILAHQKLKMNSTIWGQYKIKLTCNPQKSKLYVHYEGIGSLDFLEVKKI